MRKVIAWSWFPHFWAEYTVVEVRRSRIIEVENIESRWNESFPSPHLVFIVFRGRRLWEVKGRNPRATPRFLCSKERQARGNRFDSAAKLVFSRWWQRHLCPKMPYSNTSRYPGFLFLQLLWYFPYDYIKAIFGRIFSSCIPTWRLYHAAFIASSKFFPDRIHVSTYTWQFETETWSNIYIYICIASYSHNQNKKFKSETVHKVSTNVQKAKDAALLLIPHGMHHDAPAGCSKAGGGASKIARGSFVVLAMPKCKIIPARDTEIAG